MKRFFVFLGIFAVGLGALLWIQSRLPKPVPVVAPSTEPSAATEPQGDLTTFQTDKGKQIQGVLSGPVDIYTKWPLSHRLRSHMTAKNAVSVSEGVYDLTTVVLQNYGDVSPSELDSETHAGSARAKINSDLKQAALDETYPITLFEVVATLTSGSRFCPLTMNVPVLEGVYGTKHFESHEQVVIDGRGLKASGHGLVFDGLSESMRLLENPQAAVELKAGDIAHLSSRGELYIHSRDDLGPDVVELEAKDQAVLRLESAEAFALNADVVRLFGVIVKGEAERFVPTRAEAEGHVTLEPAEGVFSGNTALIEFDATGKPLHAALDGDPRCNLVLRGARLENVPSELLVEGETMTVTLEGAGPLELFFDAGERFLFTGPATLRLPGVGATLHGNGSIGGALGDDGRFHELEVKGGTTAVYEDSHVETEDLSVTEFVDAQGRAAMRMVAPGAAHAAGTLLDGRTFDLTASGGMTAERRRDGFLVPKGDGVDIVVKGEHAFKAHAEHVRDFDSQQLTLGADGHVHYENEEGSGDGEHLETFAPQRGEMTGTEEVPARFAFAQGTFQAHYIEFEPDRIQARVDARAKVAFGDEHYDLSARWAVVERNPTPEDREPSHGYVLDAGGDVHAHVTSATELWNLGSQLFHAVADVQLDEHGKEKLVPAGLTASDGVAFDYTGKLKLRGNGDRLEVTADRIGHLYPTNEPDAKVDLAGTLPDKDLDFRMRAASVDFSPETLIAIGPDIDLQGLDLPWASRDAPQADRALRAVAGRIACDKDSIFLSEGVYIGGRTPTHEDWSLDAPRVLLSGSAEKTPGEDPYGALHDLLAWGGFSARMGAMGSMTGEHMQLVNSQRTITIAGEPAQINQPGATWKSTWFDLDLDTGFVRSEAGEMRAAGEPKQGASWSLRYSGLEPITTADATIQVMRDPVVTVGDEQIRASWAIAWVDATEWGKFTGAVMPKPGEQAVPRDPPPSAPNAQHKKQAKPANVFERFRSSEISRWLREVYLEGNVEYRKHDERNARAEAAYFDLLDGHGWLRDVDLSIEVPFRGRDDTLKVQADWMHVSQDGSMQAYNAVATSCSFDEPHYVIHIGNYSRKPRYKEDATPQGAQPPTDQEKLGYTIEMTDNSIASPGGVEIPVPRIAYPTDPDGGIDKNAFNVGGITIPSFGKDSKFGTFISTSVTTQLGWISEKLNLLFNKLVFPKLDLPKPEGHVTYSGAYFGSRGGRVGSEADIDSPGYYHMNVRLDVIYDTGEDHGLVRVPETDRSEFRSWFRERGRFFLDDGEWIDAVITLQTDPGVQSEFFESDYLAYEERENYLHWRRAEGVEYWAATIEARVESFRTEVIDQPSLEYFRGRSQIGSLGHYALLYSSDTNVAHLARFNGDPAYEAPFADGLGDRDVIRFDTEQRVDMPIPLGVMGLRFTPFTEGRVTGWSDNAAEDSTASRAALLGGAELATTFWKQFDSGARHAWSPSITYHGDVASADNGQPVVFYDPKDAPIEGQFVDFAVRSRWEQRELKSDLDIELRETHADGTPSGAPDGWLPLVVRATWLTSVQGMPVGATHDAHYNTASGQTDYSRTFFGFEPRPELDLETGFNWARDLAGDPLYNALSVGARYELSHKWELEGHETFSVKDNGDRLASSFLLRRIGHDFVVELTTSVVAGEGSSSFSVNVTPLLTWKPSGDSMIDRWRALRK